MTGPSGPPPGLTNRADPADMLVAEADRPAARKLRLRVLATDPRAEALYCSCGFVQEGRFVGEFLLGGVAVDDLVLARTLGSLGPVPPSARRDRSAPSDSEPSGPAGTEGARR